MKNQPERRCIGCRTSFSKASLIRIVKKSDGEVIIDKNGKADGRGAYICKDMSCIEKAFKKNQLEYSFKIKINNETKLDLKESLSGLIVNTETEIN